MAPVGERQDTIRRRAFPRSRAGTPSSSEDADGAPPARAKPRQRTPSMSTRESVDSSGIPIVDTSSSDEDANAFKNVRASMDAALQPAPLLSGAQTVAVVTVSAARQPQRPAPHAGITGAAVQRSCEARSSGQEGGVAAMVE